MRKLIQKLNISIMSCGKLNQSVRTNKTKSVMQTHTGTCKYDRRDI